jgi:hypothetical protein
MRAFFALLWHEIRERRAMLVAAVIIALGIPLVTPLLPGTGSNPPEDVREILMWFAAGCVIPVFALLMGASFIGRDLAEGRLGFFYAQPLSGPTIWFGKLMAAAAVIWASQLIIMLPTAILSGEAGRILAARGLFFVPIGEWASSVIFWLGPFAVVLLAHALGIVWRARSVWIVGDVIALVALVVAVRLVEGPFLQVLSANVLLVITGWLVGAALLGLVAAGAVQVTVGRIDARRGHRVLSAVLWSVLAAAVITAAMWSHWVRTAVPSDLVRVNGISMGSGDWIAVTGHSVGRFDYFPGFIVNTTDGRWILAHSGSNVHERSVAFSSDQRLAVWTEPISLQEARLMAVDLGAERLRSRSTGIAVRRDWRDLVVSPNGRRAALIENDSVTVYEIESGALVAGAQVAGGFQPFRIRFRDEKTLEVLTGRREHDNGDASEYRMLWREHGFDLVTRSMSAGRYLDGAWRWSGRLLENQLLERLQKRKFDGKDRLFLIDPSTDEPVADLGELPTRWSDVRVSINGWIVIAREENEGKTLEVFNQHGGRGPRIEISDPGWLRIGGEVAPGQLAVGFVVWANDAGEPAERLTRLVDVATGEVVETLGGVSPVLGRWGLRVSPGAWRVGSVATRLFLGNDGTLHILNPDTYELTRMLPVRD